MLYIWWVGATCSWDTPTICIYTCKSMMNAHLIGDLSQYISGNQPETFCSIRRHILQSNLPSHDLVARETWVYRMYINWHPLGRRSNRSKHHPQLQDHHSITVSASAIPAFSSPKVTNHHQSPTSKNTRMNYPPSCKAAATERRSCPDPHARLRRLRYKAFVSEMLGTTTIENGGDSSVGSKISNYSHGM